MMSKTKIKQNIKKVKFKDIETPTTVEGFRDNLKKYFTCIGSNNLYVMNSHGSGIPICDLNQLDDLYKITGLSQVKIAPLIEWDMDDVSVYMNETNQYRSSDGFFENTNKYTIYQTTVDLWRYGKPMWMGIDNKIVREFYVKTLGDFSGYVTQE